MDFNKFGLTWLLTFRNPSQSEQIEISYPLTIEFNIERNISNSLNTASIRIKNLEESIRNKFQFDHYRLVDFDKSLKNYKQIILQAGYDGNLTTIFAGNLLQGYSYRAGVDIITFMNCGDGAYAVANSYSNFTINRGQSTNDLIKNLINDLTGTGTVNVGAIANVDGNIKKAQTISNYTSEIFDKINDAKLTIDLEKINLLKTYDVIDEITLIDGDSGLLTTPIRENSYINFDMLFEPKIKLGQLIKINSSINPVYNGQYKVYGVKHSGTISKSANSSVKTSLQAFIGAIGFNAI
jgi:hypothetical protein